MMLDHLAGFGKGLPKVLQMVRDVPIVVGFNEATFIKATSPFSPRRALSGSNSRQENVNG